MRDLSILKEPAHFNCGRPYSLTYSGVIYPVSPALPEDAKPETVEAAKQAIESNRALILDYVSAFQGACNRLLAILKPIVLDPKYELVMSLMLLPKNVSGVVQQSPIWQDLMGEKARVWGDPGGRQTKERHWNDLNLNAGYHLLCVLVNPRDASLATSRPSRIWQRILSEYPLEVPLLPEDALNDAFAKLAYKDDRNQVTNIVLATICSWYSNRCRTNTEREERRKIRQSFLTAEPQFFTEFDVYCQDQRAWLRGCRHYHALRRALQPELEPAYGKESRKVLAACQRQAMSSEAASHLERVWKVPFIQWPTGAALNGSW